MAADIFGAARKALVEAGIAGEVKAIRRYCPPPFDRATWSVVLEDGREYELASSGSLTPVPKETANA